MSARSTPSLWAIGGAIASCVATLGGCAPRLPAAYTAHVRKAQAAYGEGDYRGAVGHWQAASASAPSERHRAEARYRQAASLQRSGDASAARRLYAQIAALPSERQARAAFEAAYLQLKSAETAEGYRALERLLVLHPESGNTRRALEVVLEHKRKTLGIQGEGSWLSAFEPRVRGTELEQTVAWIRAERLEETEGPRVAVRAYLALAQRFPYPGGAYWDEAILRAATLQLELGEPREALSNLRRMLKEREAPVLVGSYERHFSDAHFLVAVIYRDTLKDWRAARSEFRAVAKNYESSLLQDDALWQSLLLSQQHGDLKAACTDALLLAKTLPHSRYVGCVHLFCDTAAPGLDKCPSYAVREVDTAETNSRQQTNTAETNSRQQTNTAETSATP